MVRFCCQFINFALYSTYQMFFYSSTSDEDSLVFFSEVNRQLLHGFLRVLTTTKPQLLRLKD